jgi:hypothetical protein
MTQNNWIDQNLEKPKEYDTVLILYNIVCEECEHMHDHKEFGIGFYSDSWSLCDIQGAYPSQKSLSTYYIVVSHWMEIPDPPLNGLIKLS